MADASMSNSGIKCIFILGRFHKINEYTFDGSELAKSNRKPKHTKEKNQTKKTKKMPTNGE